MGSQKSSLSRISKLAITLQFRFHRYIPRAISTPCLLLPVKLAASGALLLKIGQLIVLLIHVQRSLNAQRVGTTD
jgi:bacteriorhodopsin